MLFRSAIQIKAEFTTDPDTLKFTADRPVYPNGSAHFPNKEQAKGSPLAEGVPLAQRLFETEHVVEVTLAGNVVTVKKNPAGNWTTMAKPIGAAIRAQLELEHTTVLEKARLQPASSDGM